LDKNKRFPIDDDDFEKGAVVSATECTGLMYNPPHSKEDVISYTDIYDIPQPENNPLDDRERASSVTMPKQDGEKKVL